MTRRVSVCVLGILCVLGAATVFAQFQMPDAKEMSGIPRPVDDLPTGSISVRLVRGSLSNNITNFPVQLHAGSKATTVKTDDNGRAQFDHLNPGAMVKATADVDGEHLESQEFAVPAQGGIRLMLVATDRTKAAAPPLEAIKGDVTLTNQSRIVLEWAEQGVALYYVLDIANNNTRPVNPSTPFAFDMPKGATGTTLMQGSSALASVNGTRVTVNGPFPSGRTIVQVACELPAGSGAVKLSQKFPANLEQLAVVVKKVGDTKVESRQLSRQQEFPADGQMYIASTGGAVPAGQPIEVNVIGYPHHSAAPRWIALSLAAAIVLAGVWSARRPGPGSGDVQVRAAERKRLLARRDKLFNELVRLENDRRLGRAGEEGYTTRREELFAALENVYSALDTDDAGPEPSGRVALAPRLGELRAS